LSTGKTQIAKSAYFIRNIIIIVSARTQCQAGRRRRIQTAPYEKAGFYGRIFQTSGQEAETIGAETGSPAQAKQPRIILLDELRGFAVLLMIFYHGFYVAYAAFDFSIGKVLFDFFTPVEPFFAGLFIVISGISSRLSRSNAKRGLKLLGVALAVTLVTAVLLPLAGAGGFGIYFGILHFLALSMLAFAALRPLLDKIKPAWGAAASFALYFLTRGLTAGWLGPNISGFLKFSLPARLYEIPWLFPLGVCTSSFSSADYFPLIPWFFIFAAGTFLGAALKQGKVPGSAYRRRVPPLAFLGRHALAVYIAHVPAVAAVLALVTLLLRLR